jgi:hypothetical protein
MYSRPLGAGIDLADPNSKLAPFYFAPGGVFAAALVAAAFSFYTFLPLNHTDVWVHLKYGERIVETRELPKIEPFSPYSDKTTKLVNAQWLTQVVYALTFKTGVALHRGDESVRWLGGAEALRVLHAAAVAAFLGLMALAVKRAGGCNTPAVLAVLLLIPVMFLTFGVHRPQMFGLMMFAAVLATVSRPDLPRRVSWTLPLLMTVWANLHGSFAVGFVLLGVMAVGRAVDAARVGNSLRTAAADVSLRRLVIGTALAVIAVGLLNPYGPKLYLAVLTFGSNPNLKYLMEWEPLKATERAPGTLVYWGLLAANLFAAAVGFRSLSVARLLVVLAFAVPPHLQQRMLVWFVTVGVWGLMAQVGAIAVRLGWTAPAIPPNLRLTVVTVLLVVPLLLLSSAARWVKDGPPTDPKVVHPGTAYELAAVLRDPTAPTTDRMKPLAEYLRKNYAGRSVGLVFGSEGVGEFLTWADPPGCPPFFCTHAHLFPAGHYRDSQIVLNGVDGWKQVLDRYNVNLVAVEPNVLKERTLVPRLAADPDWQVVLNESGSSSRPDPRAQLFIAVRKVPK